jgi:two-component system response regulator HydG
MEKILVIDDDLDILQLLKRFLSRKGFEVLTASNGNAGIALLESEDPDLVMTDFRLGDMDGSEILQRIKERAPHVPVLVITGYSDIRVAVNVMKHGAFDYITKPIIPDEILLTIQKALDAPQGATAAMPPPPSATSGAGMADPAVDTPVSARSRPKSVVTESGYVIGVSPAALTLYRQIDLVSPTNYSVIVYGESGSGKEAVARMIHDRSARRDQPFVAMDCGAISKDLANSELFGHEKGSFTGAMTTKIGHFELANGGTLFLDEVGNLSYDVQVALLRVVQERKLKRIGGTKEIPLDVRIIVASNERLSSMIRTGKFREDLYHRFNEFSLDVPPLRERREDIMLFAERFLEDTCRELNKNVTAFASDVVDIFLRYPWYGNVRELKNVIKRATLLTDGDRIEAKSLPFEIAHFSRLHELELPDKEPDLVTNSAPPRPVTGPLAPATGSTAPGIAPSVAGAGNTTAAEITNLKAAANSAEYEMIMKVLQEARYNKSKAAQMLGIDRKTLYNKLKNYNIE